MRFPLHLENSGQKGAPLRGTEGLGPRTPHLLHGKNLTHELESPVTLPPLPQSGEAMSCPEKAPGRAKGPRRDRTGRWAPRCRSSPTLGPQGTDGRAGPAADLAANSELAPGARHFLRVLTAPAGLRTPGPHTHHFRLPGRPARRPPTAPGAPGHQVVTGGGCWQRDPSRILAEKTLPNRRQNKDQNPGDVA